MKQICREKNGKGFKGLDKWSQMRKKNRRRKKWKREKEKYDRK